MELGWVCKNEACEWGPLDNMLGERKNVVRVTAAARGGQNVLVVVIEESVLPNSEAAGDATHADIELVQEASDVERQCSTGGGDAFREEEDEFCGSCAGFWWSKACNSGRDTRCGCPRAGRWRRYDEGGRDDGEAEYGELGAAR